MTGTVWALDRSWQQNLGLSQIRKDCWVGKQQTMSSLKPNVVQSTRLSFPSLAFVAYFQETAGVVVWKTVFWMVAFPSSSRYPHILDITKGTSSFLSPCFVWIIFNKALFGGVGAGWYSSAVWECSWLWELYCACSRGWHPQSCFYTKGTHHNNHVCLRVDKKFGSIISNILPSPLPVCWWNWYIWWQGINETQVDSMLSAVRGMWQRFTYHHAVKLEAKRQNLNNKTDDLWAVVYNSLTGDDAFSTFIQVRNMFLQLASIHCNRPSSKSWKFLVV